MYELKLTLFKADTSTIKNTSQKQLVVPVSNEKHKNEFLSMSML